MIQQWPLTSVKIKTGKSDCGSTAKVELTTIAYCQSSLHRLVTSIDCKSLLSGLHDSRWSGGYMALTMDRLCVGSYHWMLNPEITTCLCLYTAENPTKSFMWAAFSQLKLTVKMSAADTVSKSCLWIGRDAKFQLACIIFLPKIYSSYMHLKEHFHQIWEFLLLFILDLQAQMGSWDI